MKAPYADLGPVVDAIFLEWLDRTPVPLVDVKVYKLLSAFLLSLNLPIR
jgi:hypothetical protein